MARPRLEPRIVFENSFFSVGVLETDTVIITRSPQPFESKADIEAGCWPVQLALDGLRRAGKRLLVDTRLAVGNNDAAFEANFSDHRRRMVVGFDRVALLVETAVGRLQNERLAVSPAPRPPASTRGKPPPPSTAPRVFMSFDQAIEYLRAPAG